MAEPEHRSTIIRTMKTDSDELLQKEKSSFLDLFTKEGERRAMEGMPLPTARIGMPQETTQRNPWKMVALFLGGLIVLGALAFGAYFFLPDLLRTNPKEIPKGPDIPRPLIKSAQKNQTIEVRKNDRTGLLAKIEEVPRDSTYTYIPILTEGGQIMRVKEFFDTVRIAPPSRDFYNGISDRIDVYKLGNDIVFVFEVRDKEKTQGNLIEWEHTLPQDFLTIFLAREAGAFHFSDRLIRNVDARVALEENPPDTHALSYSVREDFFILTTSEEALRATIDRVLEQ